MHRPFTGYEEATGHLLLLDSCQEPKRGLQIPASAVNGSPHLTIHTGLVDSHLYVLHKRHVQEAMAQRPTLASIRNVSHQQYTTCSVSARQMPVVSLGLQWGQGDS